MSNLTATDRWEELADMLRNEFSEYGGLLSLLQEQQQGIVKRDPMWLSERNMQIEQQALRANECRIQRERYVRELCIDMDLPQDTKLVDLLDYVPDMTRAMFEALLQVCKETAEKVKRMLSRNRMLLMRAQGVTQEMIQRIQPLGTTKGYNRQGAYFKSMEMRGRGVNLTA
jgi:hypothetical protein